MKKVFVLLLCCCMLLSMAACKKAEEESSGKKVTVYVVTEQKDYVNGQLDNTATFKYDKQGRPVEVGFAKADGLARKSELTYDEEGNLIQSILTSSYPEIAEPYVQQVDWTLRYSGDLLTQADQSGYMLKFSYDDDEQLTLVEYPQPEEGMGGYLWQNYEYDDDGKLIRETRCASLTSGFASDMRVWYQYSRVSYFYDNKGRLQEQHYSSANSDDHVAPEDLGSLDFTISDLDHFFFYYDKDGNLAYLGNGPEDTYEGGKAEIYSDEKCTFDDNGNLVRIDRGITSLGHSEPSWTEYTYEAIELKKSDAVMHKRLIHGISNFTLGYTIYNTMDPLFWNMCPATLYNSHLMSMNFYYLIPYPQFELFLKK